MKTSLIAYISVVIMLGAALLGFDLIQLQQLLAAGEAQIPEMLIWLALIVFVSRFHIMARSGQAVSTMNSALDYCLILCFGPAFAAVAVATNSLYLNAVRRRSIWYKVLFNSAQLVIAINAAGGLYILAGGTVGRLPDLLAPLTYLQLLIPFFGFSLLNLLLVSFAVRLDRGIPVRRQMRHSHYYEIWSNFILFYFGVLLAALYMAASWPGVVVAAIPLVWVYNYTKRYNELKEMHSELDLKNRKAAEQSSELEEKARDLERLNRNLSEQKSKLQRQAAELEEANLALSESNARLEHSRDRLVRVEKLKAMGQMAGGVAHDFNNILGAIIARSELLKLEYPDHLKMQEGLELIHKSALDGAAVVRRIQDFTRVTEERNFRAVDLSGLITDVLELTRAIWRDKAQRLGITYEIERNFQPGMMVYGNASELREVLLNLMLNALEAMPGGGRLGLGAELREGQVRVQVTDTGHGMTPEVLERLFDPFFTTKGARGNGLGLSVSAGIIERHGGSIEVRSKPGAGSCFTLSLSDSREAAEAQHVEDLESVKASLSSARKRSILVVDDEKDVRDVLVELLEVMGHNVDEAETGQQGLNLFRERRHQVVFTDLGMPGMNGWELADRIREEETGSSQHAHLVLVTGWGAQVKQENLERHRVEQLLAKPFKIEEVKSLLDGIGNAAVHN